MKYGWSFQKFFFFVIKVQIIIFFPPFVDELNGNPFFQFGCSIQWGVKSLKSLLLSLWGFPYCLEAAWSMNKLKENGKKEVLELDYFILFMGLPGIKPSKLKWPIGWWF